jgi:hypothetical protein
MIEFNQIVDPESSIETKPDYDNRGECDGNFCCTERLNQEQKNENSTSGPNNGGFSDIRLDDIEPLDGTKNRLC